ncbi:hypothetical protein GJU41_11900 [Bacillus idriensis]|uniref:Uncharacterized protein n=1 Tax=Metabacillus idriensis TaxID=324768 RepID=A0A6I2MCB9_9BACI|nr:hypothetical protein [Metabacillus idriensis]MRX54676.1 hypothetical protein [Metabacillus idriensis]
MTRMDERLIKHFTALKTDDEKIAVIMALALVGEDALADECKRIYTEG